jgi:hypothetical protein
LDSGSSHEEARYSLVLLSCIEHYYSICAICLLVHCVHLLVCLLVLQVHLVHLIVHHILV